MIDCSKSDAICLIESENKFDAIKEVIDKCRVFDDLREQNNFFEIVKKREMIETTGIGHSIGIAHGKIKCLENIKVGLGVSKKGVDYDSVDDQRVHLLFVIASSAKIQMQYIRALSGILRMASREEVRESLLAMKNIIDNKMSCYSLIKLLDNQVFEY